MTAPRVLLAGESWVSNSTHFKGWDFFSSTVYETGIVYLRKAMQEAAIDFTHLPSHLAANDFPLTLADLDHYDVVILSDIGANCCSSGWRMAARSPCVAATILSRASMARPSFTVRPLSKPCL